MTVNTTTGPDVTIILVPPTSATDHHPNPGRIVTRKRARKSHANSSLTPPPQPLLIVRAFSSHLRECSKYFEACMSGRWPTAQTKCKFHLEAHTHPQFYEECFIRMHNLPVTSNPIESVSYCIELLKVASQIQYDHLVDVGVRYLASVPWSKHEEDQIRRFCTSGLQLCTSSSATDLFSRLQLHSSEQERQQQVLDTLKRALCRSMKEGRQFRVFKETFAAIVAGTGRPESCSNFLPTAIALVLQEVRKALDSIRRPLEDQLRPPCGRTSVVLRHVVRLCNFFFALRLTHSAQGWVELLLEDENRTIAPLLRTLFRSMAEYLPSPGIPGEEEKLAEVVSTIFHDVLDGRLMLRTAERLALFQRWNWVLRVADPLDSPVVTTFIMSFPYAEQEEIFRCWLDGLDSEEHEGEYDLWEAHSEWVKHLVSQVEKFADAPVSKPVSPEREECCG